MNIFKKTRVANKYDNYYNSNLGKQIDEVEQKLINLLIKDIPRNAMLELGCGTGHWSEYFLSQGFEVTGIDNSEAMLTIAKGKKLDAKFAFADSEKIPFKDSSFATIASITMLEFVENQDKVFDEVYRVLKPGGWLILGCLNGESSLAKNKDQSETFKNANFLTFELLSKKLERFGNPKFEFGVYLNENSEIQIKSNKNKEVQPLFMAALVQKKTSVVN